MNSAKVICCLLYHAFGELHNEAVNSQSTKVMNLIMLINDLPLKIGEAVNKGNGYSDIERDFTSYLSEKNGESWLHSLIRNYQTQITMAGTENVDTEKRARDFLFYCMYQAILDIRAESLNIENQAMFKLANLFHNVPLRLSKCQANDCDEILLWLNDRAKALEINQWLNLVIEKCNISA